MTLEPIESPDLVEHVTARLRSAILAKTIAPGDRLVEEQLATSLEVSRAPVREALRILEHEGLVRSSTRRGRFVSRLSSRDAWEVYSLRENLEAMAFGILTENFDDGLPDAAAPIITSMRETAESGDRDRLSQLDVQFHRLIVQFTKHRRLLMTWDSMANQITLLSHEVVEHLYSDLSEVVKRHQELLDVLQSDDPQLARSTIHTHIDSVAEQVIKRLEEAEAKPAPPVDNGLKL